MAMASLTPCTDHCVPSPLPNSHGIETSLYSCRRYGPCRWRWKRCCRLDPSRSLRRTGQQWLWHCCFIRPPLLCRVGTIPSFCYPASLRMASQAKWRHSKRTISDHGRIDASYRPYFGLVYWHYWCTPHLRRYVYQDQF